MQSSGEDMHLDILQNIEWSILSVYRDHPDLTDYQVDSALEALGRTYQREKSGGPPMLPKNELARLTYDAIKTTCDWRLGRQGAVDEEEQPINIEHVTVEDIQSSLKRLRKSVSNWNKQGGTRGYLDYIKQFLV